MASVSVASPALLSVDRLVTLIASIFVALGSGTNYVFSAYAPQLGARLQINHTQLNVIGLAGNIGVYSSGPIWGRLVDSRGPRILLVSSFLFLLSGYSGIRHIYDAGFDSFTTLSMVLLVACSFITGSGGNAGLTSSVNATAKSFPDKARATSTGIVLSGFGLSAFFFSTLAHVAFPGDTSSFLLVLALGTSLPMIFGFFFVRPVPLPSSDSTHTMEHGTDESESDEGEEDRLLGVDAVVTNIFEGRANTSQTHLLPNSEDSHITHHTHHHHTESSHYIVPHVSDAVELSPTRSDTPITARNRSRSYPRSLNLSRGRSKVPASSGLAEKVVDGPNITGKELWSTGDFWLFFTIMSLLSGTGLMYINNVGSVSQALSAQGNPDYDMVEAAKWQAAQVSTVSITNCLGRIIIGLAADFTKNRLHLPRVYCASLVALMFLISQVTCMSIEDVQNLWKASASLGLAYGGLFGLFPTLMIEWFGLPHFSENWGYLSLSPMLGGNLFSIAFGTNLDAHAPSDHQVSGVSSLNATAPSLLSRDGLPSIHQCYEGRECYVASLYMTTSACFVALGLSLWAAWRDRQRKQEVEVIWEVVPTSDEEDM
ncbi:hypothetical protein JAAARDRAFT_162309 [Jaapia argillacea MUCL 33604]|uniref:Nodulin-like domain-containing protein n=1 Tax=Jaapia argillacea MUCL 33604 TaxID=933084 RepID=A0A067PGU7_9AGAM|nr:hypothetical protein JAAARDRAFT_162309 [Jaapia argillacea MUCL 33604]